VGRRVTRQRHAGRYEAPQARSTTEGSIPLISTKEKDIRQDVFFLW